MQGLAEDAREYHRVQVGGENYRGESASNVIFFGQGVSVYKAQDRSRELEVAT